MKKNSLILCASTGLLLASCSSFALTVVNNSSTSLYAWSGIKYQEHAVALPASKSTPIPSALLGTDPQHEYLNLATDTSGTAAADFCGNLAPKYPGDFKLDHNSNDQLIINADKTCTYKASSGPAPSTQVVAPYRIINVGQDYTSSTLSSILPAYTYVANLDKNNRPLDTTVVFADKTPDIIKQYFNIDKYGNLLLTKNITNSQDPLLKSAKDIGNGQKLLQFNLVNTKDPKKVVTANIVLNNGIHTKSVLELTNESTAKQKDLLQVPGTDGSVDLSQYFTTPTGGNNNVTYQLDAEKVNGSTNKTVDPSIVEITHLGQATPIKGSANNVAGFSIKGNKLTFGKMDSAIYQISIKATDSNGGSAFETFYVNNLNAADKADFFKINGHDFSLIYTYTNSDPSKDANGFNTEMSKYGKDIGHANTKDLGTHPVTVVAAEFGGPTYSNLTAPYWQTKGSNQAITSFSQLQQQIQPSAVQNVFTDLSWIAPDFIKPVQDAAGAGVTVSPDLTFGQNIRASISTYNQDQLGYTTDSLMKYVLDPKTGKAYAGIKGLSLDLEQGTASEADNMFKTMSDRLAYHGLFLGYYEFSDKSFTPDNLAAMGPLGISLVSAYDVTAHRSVDGTGASAADAFSSDDATTLKEVFKDDSTCDVTKNNQQTVQSWCNQSVNDTKAANITAWSVMNKHKNAAKSPMVLFNAHYSPVLPLSSTATNWAGEELWNPDLKKLAAEPQGGLVLTDSSIANGPCSMIGSYTQSDAGLQHCLFADPTNTLVNTVNGKKLNTIDFHSCGAGIPLSKCLYISALPGSNAQHLAFRATQADYVNYTANAYTDPNTNKVYPGFIGFSLYALHDAKSAPDSGGFAGETAANKAVQEPWYVGWNGSDADKNLDPQYQAFSSTLDSLWKSVATSYKDAN